MPDFANHLLLRPTAIEIRDAGPGRVALLALLLLSNYLVGTFDLRGAAAGAKKTTKRTAARLNPDPFTRDQQKDGPESALAKAIEIQTNYRGPADLVEQLRQNQAQPLALASADFDEDGVPDLVIGYVGAGAGMVSLLRGNVDAIYPNSPEAQARRAASTFTDAPFLSPAGVFAAPVKPDFIGAGDFDADGHWDVVVASRGSDKLFLLAGDGTGKLVLTNSVSLPGQVTAMAVGEINRRDGLDDVVVGVAGQVLVFEGPLGALRSQPEVFGVKGAPTALALGRFDNDSASFNDLAIAADQQVIFIYGRDRRLSLDESVQAQVLPAVVERHWIGSTVTSMHAGSFQLLPRSGEELAFLSGAGEVFLLKKTGRSEEKLSLGIWPQASAIIRARISAGRFDDLVVLDKAGQTLQLINFEANRTPVVNPLERLSGEPLAALPMRLNSDALTDLVILRAQESTPTIVATLPNSIITVNSAADSNVRDTVLTLREAVLLANGQLAKSELSPEERAQVQMEPTRGRPDAIRFNIPRDETKIILLTARLRVTDSVTIDGTTQDSVATAYPIKLVNEGLTLDFDSSSFTNTAAGSVVRGLEIAETELPISIAQFNYGIIEGNKIDGTISVAEADFITVGGTAAPAGNLAAQIRIAGDETVVQGNTCEYVFISGETFGRSKRNLVGGTQAKARNLISGIGIELLDFSYSALVQGNIITYNGMHSGVYLLDTYYNTIGGTSPNARNIITGSNQYEGISILNSGLGNIVQGNLTNGVSSREVSRSYIGGSVPRAGNVISGYHGDAVSVVASADSIVQGNFIGTDESGTRAIGNGGNGVVSTSAKTLIKNNIVSASGKHGVAIGLPRARISGSLISGGTGTVVVNNRIGTDITGTKDLGNALNGVFVDNNSVEHTVRGNVIAFNKKDGVFIPDQGSGGLPGYNITVLSNSIFANGGTGIALAQENGIANFQRASPQSANQGQNIPILESITADASGRTTVTGRLLQPPDEGFRIELYSSSPVALIGSALRAQPGNCRREGETPMGIVAVAPAQVNPNGSFTITYPTPVGSGYINATATSGISGIGDTSEFSVCQALSDLKVSNEVTTTGIVVAGQTLTYKMTVENLGRVPAQTVKLRVAVPEFTTYQSSRLLAGSAGTWTSELPAVGSGQGEIIWNAEGLPAGESASFEVVVRIVDNNPAVGPGAKISSTATVTSATLDFNPQNNSQARTIELSVPPADLAVMLERLPGQVFTGDDLSLRVTVLNYGPSVANAVRLELSEAAPRNTVFRTATDLGGWRREVDNSGTVTYAADSFPSKAAAQFTVTVRIVKGAVITFTARVSSGTPEPSAETSGNNAQSISVTVADPPPGPLLQEITVLPDGITAVGIGFASPVRVFVDDVAFESPAVVEEGRRVTQRGTLANGKSIAEAIPPGKTVLIKFLNPDGGRIIVSFRN